MASVTLSSESTGLTFVNVWTTPSAEDQAQLLQAMQAEAPAMTHLPGFISLSFLPSLDGKQLVVLAQWESQQAFDAAISNDTQQLAARQALSKWGETSAHVVKVEAIYPAAR